MSPRYIPLGRGQVARVDDRDYAFLMQFAPWRRSSKGYAIKYRTSEGVAAVWYMHRLVMERLLDEALPPGYQVDHLNRERLDNQRANLRLATRSQNQANKGIQVNNNSTQKGVTFRAGKWEVRLRYYGKRLYLGRFDQLESAAAAYGCAHRLLWGEFSTETDPVSDLLPAVVQRLRAVLMQHGIRLDR